MEYWQHITNSWKPALEIFILAVGIYFAFNFIRGTRGAPVVYGFVILLLSLTLIAWALKLTVLQSILKFFGLFSPVAVLIIFQQEIRRILAELGTRPLFTSAREQRENIEVIVQTVERLAEVKIGALMAIEQSIHLQDVVESGIIVDCEATPEMLETIFFPNNAVHDGGVIIIGDRIAYAACIFPLTQRQDLNPSLGTRHRAAIGLSEETDALVVIVSEETGAISYTYKGQLVKGITAEQLRAFLTSVLVPRAKSKSVTEWLKARFINREHRENPGPAVVPKAKAESLD